MGRVERGVRKDLKALPDNLKDGAVAQAALLLARDLDSGNLLPRDAAAYLAQLRHCMAQLREWAPGEAKGDTTDAARTAREKRLLHAVPDE